MKKSLVLVSLLSMSPGLLYAQGAGVDKDIDAELDQIAASRTAPNAAAAAGSNIAPTQVGSGAGAKTIYIVNQATPTAGTQATVGQGQAQKAVQPSNVQVQPEVNVTSTALSKSRAEEYRDLRQQEEVHTENKVVEKLEKSRMEDEKRRAEALFGDGFKQLEKRDEPTKEKEVVAAPAPVSQPAPVAAQPAPAPVQQILQPIYVQPAPAPVVVKEEEHHEELRAEMKRDDDEEKHSSQRYFGAMAGIGDAPDAQNVRGNYSLGVSIGSTIDSQYQLEGSFTYSDYSVDSTSVGYLTPYGVIPASIDTKQYSLGMGAKYLILDGMIRPTVGGLAQYSYRSYSWAQNQYGGGYGYNNSGGGASASSHAVDLGVSAGVDFMFNKKMSLGVDFRYMFNLWSQTNSSSPWFNNCQYYGGKPLEQLQYYMAGVVGKVNF